MERLIVETREIDACVGRLCDEFNILQEQVVAENLHLPQLGEARRLALQEVRLVVRWLWLESKKLKLQRQQQEVWWVAVVKMHVWWVVVVKMQLYPLPLPLLLPLPTPICLILSNLRTFTPDLLSAAGSVSTVVAVSAAGTVSAPAGSSLLAVAATSGSEIRCTRPPKLCLRTVLIRFSDLHHRGRSGVTLKMGDMMGTLKA
ncbi:hypothetical protein Ahy_B04g069176 isoform A [Arachis hypogaea]|uniref:Uncharacterized protein n=1 Tax=Arachis hypogaea TaxID=3818 RepID=A0A444ZBV3_ARAHY|nr:hypothetical protein Ahy_B04g069176 isoform A [Arachis hypogaea]